MEGLGHYILRFYENDLQKLFMDEVKYIHGGYLRGVKSAKFQRGSSNNPLSLVRPVSTILR